MKSKLIKKIDGFGKYNLPVHIFFDNVQNVYKAYIYYGKRNTTCVSYGETITDIEKDISKYTSK